MDREFNPNRKLTYDEKEAAIEMKKSIILTQNTLCAKCGGSLIGGPVDIAHRIPKAKMYIKKYGWSVINHRFNLRATHHKAECNDGVLLDPKTHPIEADELIKQIREDLNI